MSECPTPVIMLSAENSADVTITLIHYGAVDFIQNLQETIRLDIAVIKDELIKKVKAAAGVKTSKLVFLDENKINEKPELKKLMMLIQGKSSLWYITGGPRALQQVLLYFR